MSQDIPNAFSSPTVNAKKRLGNRVPNNIGSCSDTSSVTSRRSASLVQSNQDLETFNQLMGSTSVLIKQTAPPDNEDAHETSSTLDCTCGANEAAVLTDDSIVEDKPPGDLDLRNNDNAFHVMASLLVEFFQGRCNGTSMLLLPEDRFTVQRLVPQSSVMSFVDAVHCRLTALPIVPTTSLERLTQDCAALCFDLADPQRNPILVALHLKDQPVTLTVLGANQTILEEDDDDLDLVRLVVAPTSSSHKLSAPLAAASDDLLALSNSSSSHESKSLDISSRAVNGSHVEGGGAHTSVSGSALTVPGEEQDSSSGASGNVQTVQDSSTAAAVYTGTIGDLSTSSGEKSKANSESLASEKQQQQSSVDSSSDSSSSSIGLQATAGMLINDMKGSFGSQAISTRAVDNSNVNVATSGSGGNDTFDSPYGSNRFNTLNGSDPRSKSLLSDVGQSRSSSSDEKATVKTASDRSGSIRDAPMVDVVAPADLPGGYHFEAEIEGVRFVATVPPGGVQQGQTFSCPMRGLDSTGLDIPIGYWKDGPRNFCGVGCCHPVVWHSLFCPLILLGQIQTRVDFDFLGRPRFGESPVSNRSMMMTVVIFWVVTNVCLFVACNLKWSRGMELTSADACAIALVNTTMFSFVVFVAQSTRSSLREQFMIQEDRCFDLEDLCCSSLCLPCTVSQMARHTADYDEYEAVCCSKTGLPDGVTLNQSPPEKTDGYVV